MSATDIEIELDEIESSDSILNNVKKIDLIK